MKKIAILAGTGDLVNCIIENCITQRQPFHIFTFHDQLEQPLDYINHYPHTQLHLGQVGSLIKALKNYHCTHIVMAGAIKRPQSLTDLKTDFKGALLATKLIGKNLGDDGLLQVITRYLEDEGFHVIGCESFINQDSFCDKGVLTKQLPSLDHMRDIERGLNVLYTLSSQDIGQSCIVYNGIILGIEAAEGTDQLIDRCSKLRQDKSGGILVKTLKINQETRVDRPTIGMDTVNILAHHGFHGLAIQAQGVIILNKFQVIDKANQLGLFIIGVDFDKVNTKD